MALLFMDGFDHYATADIGKKWTTFSGSGTITTGGRHSSNALVGGSGWPNTYIARTVSSGVTEMIVGVAIKYLWRNNVAGMLSFLSSTGYECGIAVGIGGAVSAIRYTSATPDVSNVTAYSSYIGSASGTTLALDTWYYLEVKVVAHNTTGSCTVKLNGTEILSVSGVDTVRDSTSLQQVALFSGEYARLVYDDLYVCDTSGPTNNDFLGDVRVDAHYPTADGNAHVWTPSTGSDNYAMVDETSPNTTDYNSVSPIGSVDTLVVEDLKNTGARIVGVQTSVCHSKEDAGTCLIASVIRPASTDVVGSDVAPSLGSYLYATTMYETNPETATTWSESGFNATEFGYKKTG